MVLEGGTRLRLRLRLRRSLLNSLFSCSLFYCSKKVEVKVEEEYF
jgi:hypothetical protein